MLGPAVYTMPFNAWSRALVWAGGVDGGGGGVDAGDPTCRALAAR